MKKNNQKGNVLVIIVIILFIIAIIFTVKHFTDFKNQKITAENFEELSEKARDELTEDETYYFAYAAMYHMFSDGLSDLTDEDAAYKNIYGKTIKELINEGKDLMEENDITVEDFKESMGSLNSIDY